MTGLSWTLSRDLPLLSLTFARGITAPELLARMGADPETVAQRDERAFGEEFGDIIFDQGVDVVTAGAYGSWAWAWEECGWRCVADEMFVCDVSAGTTAVVFHSNEKPVTELRYAEDGQLVVGFNDLLGLAPSDRTGRDIHRFDAEMRALGADPDTGDSGPLGEYELLLRIVEGLGIGIPEEDLRSNTAWSAQLLSERPSPPAFGTRPDSPDAGQDSTAPKRPAHARRSGLGDL